MKKLVRIFFLVIVAFIGFVFLYWFIALISRFIEINQSFESPKEGEGVEVFITSNGVHTDIVIPLEHSRKNWKIFLNDVNAKNAKYAGFGWGDKGFYLNTPNWADLKFSTAFYAMFWKSPTAMHVTYYPSKLKKSASVKKIIISEEQYKVLVHYIEQSFAMKNDKPMLLQGKSYDGYPNSFFEATGSYHFLKTCNEWTRMGLATSGVKTIFWSPFADGLMK